MRPRQIRNSNPETGNKHECTNDRNPKCRPAIPTVVSSQFFLSELPFLHRFYSIAWLLKAGKDCSYLRNLDTKGEVSPRRMK